MIKYTVTDPTRDRKLIQPEDKSFSVILDAPHLDQSIFRSSDQTFLVVNRHKGNGCHSFLMTLEEGTSTLKQEVHGYLKF